MLGCRIDYSSSETNMRGNLTIGNTKHCQILYTVVDNDEYNDNTDDDIVPELITSEYVIGAYDIDSNAVAAVESVANITVTEQPIYIIITDDTSEGMIIIYRYLKITMYNY